MQAPERPPSTRTATGWQWPSFWGADPRLTQGELDTNPRLTACNKISELVFQSWRSASGPVCDTPPRARSNPLSTQADSTDSHYFNNGWPFHSIGIVFEPTVRYRRAYMHFPALYTYSGGSAPRALRHKPRLGAYMHLPALYTYSGGSAPRALRHKPRLGAYTSRCLRVESQPHLELSQVFLVRKENPM
jgi:hypothetical protein